MLNFDWLAWLTMEEAKGVFLGLFFLIGVLILFLPREYIYEGIGHPRWYLNLKLWSIGVLLFIGSVYYMF